VGKCSKQEKMVECHTTMNLKEQKALFKKKYFFQSGPENDIIVERK
jgi:hypothetical protein